MSCYTIFYIRVHFSCEKAAISVFDHHGEYDEINILLPFSRAFCSFLRDYSAKKFHGRLDSIHWEKDDVSQNYAWYFGKEKQQRAALNVRDVELAGKMQNI